MKRRLKRKPVVKKQHNLVAMGGWIVLCELIGVIGSIFTIAQIPTWYATLVKPAFSPPNWVFAPVWVTLYALMGIAAYRIWSLGIQKPAVRIGIELFMGQLFLNVLWSILFFTLHDIRSAFVGIAILWALIMYLAMRFEKLDKTAGYLMVPYILWVSFALVLNYYLLILNA